MTELPTPPNEPGERVGARGPTRWKGAAAALAVVLLFGGWLRLADLGGPPFVGDELNHYYAATSLAAGNGPQLPSGNEYRRGLDFTQLVRGSMAIVDDPRTAARLPAALLGIISLGLIAAIGWKWGGPWAGVWAALLLAIYPEAVVHSRQTRFYTYQLCFGLIALYAGWKAIAPDEEPRPMVRAAWLALASAGFLLALRVQLTTLSVITGWFFATALLAVRDVAVYGRRAWTRFSVAIVSLSLIGGLGWVVLDSSTVGRLLAQASYVALWAGGAPGDLRSYYWELTDAFPVLVALAPVSFLAVWLRRPWLGVYLLSWFAVPLIAHTFLLPWKSERYVFLAIPGLLLATAVALAPGLGALSDRVARTIRALRPGLGNDWAVRIGWGTLMVVAIVPVLTSRALNDSLERPTPQPIRHWSTAAQIIAEAGLETVPLGSSQGLVALYHWPRLDFVVGTDFLEGRNREPRLRPVGSPDWYSGVPVLTKPESIRGSFPRARIFAIAVDRARWEYGNIDPDLREALMKEGENLCDDTCGHLLLFRWVPRADEAPPAPGGDASPGAPR